MKIPTFITLLSAALIFAGAGSSFGQGQIKQVRHSVKVKKFEKKPLLTEKKVDSTKKELKKHKISKKK